MRGLRRVGVAARSGFAASSWNAAQAAVRPDSRRAIATDCEQASAGQLIAPAWLPHPCKEQRRGADHSCADAGPLRRRGAAGSRGAGGLGVGGQLERDHVVASAARLVLEGPRTRRRARRRGRAVRAPGRPDPAALRRRRGGLERQPGAVHGRGGSPGAGAQVPRPCRRLRRYGADRERRRSQRRGAGSRGVRAAWRSPTRSALLQTCSCRATVFASSADAGSTSAVPSHAISACSPRPRAAEKTLWDI